LRLRGRHALFPPKGEEKKAKSKLVRHRRRRLASAPVPEPALRTAAWRHVEAREGFEVLFLAPRGDGWRLEGHATAVEDGEAWSIRYAVSVDDRWRTRSASISVRSAVGDGEVHLEADGTGGWRVDGVPAPELDGCLDVDLEASACTNALPVRRLGLAVGEASEAPAAYVRALGLGVQRLEQRYARLADDGGCARYDYAAPAFDFEAILVYDEASLVVDYPGIAVRVL
jgi:uncharacterized protein